ncbi:MAG: RibD family protein, partial [Gammaproteobacteria bacterium]|nr:RibD family protein [Gammaproteobacteria bacterium]
RQEGCTLVVTASEDGEAAEELVNAGAEVIQLSSASHGVNLQELMKYLADRECNEVMIEAGATLTGSAIACGIVDELVIYLAPHIMGADAKGMFRIPGLNAMEDRIELSIVDVRSVGDDIRVTAIVKDKG